MYDAGFDPSAPDPVAAAELAGRDPWVYFRGHPLVCRYCRYSPGEGHRGGCVWRAARVYLRENPVEHDTGGMSHESEG